jgi:hypothetical protein
MGLRALRTMGGAEVMRSLCGDEFSEFVKGDAFGAA